MRGGGIWAQSPQYGWCLIEPADNCRPPQPHELENTVELSQDRTVVFPTRHVDFEQLKGISRALPVDLTFVDADDRVRFFSEGVRVFAHSRAILGVHIVDRIVSDFRANRQNAAKFCIELRGKFAHIRYFAVRSEAGEYLGTLEVMQYLTRLRSLSGERRLLQYDTTETELQS